MEGCGEGMRSPLRMLHLPPIRSKITIVGNPTMAKNDVLGTKKYFFRPTNSTGETIHVNSHLMKSGAQHARAPLPHSHDLRQCNTTQIRTKIIYKTSKTRPNNVKTTCKECP